MRRRDFIQGIVGSTAAWPIAARAQQPNRKPRIGVLMANAEADRQAPKFLAAFMKALQDLGWVEGGTVQVDRRWAAGDIDRMRTFARELVGQRPDVILGQTTPVIAALREATATIPIVFVNVSDPVGAGFVSSYAQPGGNITGFSNFEPAMGGKWAQVLRDLDPRVRRIAILFNPETAPYAKYFLPSFKTACATLGLEGIEAPVRNVTDIDQAVGALALEPSGALIAMADIFIASNRDLIIGLATKHRLPLIGAFRDFPEEGALASYGSSSIDLFRRAASYVDLILKGGKPADLPVQNPTKFELVINLKAARALGLTVNHDFLLRADDVVE